jgi:hypothetical protein
MGNQSVPLDEHGWTRLAAALREAVARQVPEWSEQPDHDPGVTIAQVFAFLGEGLLNRAAAIPEREREAIRDVVVRLGSMPCPDASLRLTVRVDDVRWREISGLEVAGPDDAVFTTSRDGEVTFGDGRHGRRPSSGARVSVAYREGEGDRGNVRVSVDTPWPPPAMRYAIALTPTPGLRICATRCGAEHFSGNKRVSFFDGKLLSVDDLREEQQYHLGKRRLHNRALHGWGVVEGLEVRVPPETTPPVVLVETGLALDACGRELVLAAPLAVAIGNGPSPRMVVIEYAERATDPVPGSDPDALVPSKIEEGVAVRLVDDAGCADGIAIGRLIRDCAGWTIDPAFEPPRLARCTARPSPL